MELSGLRALVMGLGHFGGQVGAARYLAAQGAEVTVTDLADEKALADSLAELRNVPIVQYRLGEHREEDFRNADLLIVSPAVRLENPLVEVARRAGARVATEMELFLERCPGTIVGVTGSNGKSTTAAMTAAILRAGGRRTWLGGNIGRSLLSNLGEIGADDTVVLELSSFQLAWLPAGIRMPQVVVVTSFTPNHLDWHGTLDAYAAAKQQLLGEQRPNDTAVLNLDQLELHAWKAFCTGRCIAPADDAAIPPLAVPGPHNRADARLAAAAAQAAGALEFAVKQGLSSFRGLPQRLEWFAVVDGRLFYNDSTATTPESTIAALEAVKQPVWLLAGGRDKGCDYADMIDTIVRRARGVAFYGEAAEKLAARMPDASRLLPCRVCTTMKEALRWCCEESRPGDAIVLSPACASGDQFRHFRARGEHFVALVRGMAKQIRS